MIATIGAQAWGAERGCGRSACGVDACVRVKTCQAPLLGHGGTFAHPQHARSVGRYRVGMRAPHERVGVVREGPGHVWGALGGGEVGQNKAPGRVCVVWGALAVRAGRASGSNMALGCGQGPPKSDRPPNRP